MPDLQSVFWSVAIFTALCGAMVLYALIWERPVGGQPQWTEDEE